MSTQDSEVLSQIQEEICIMGERFAVVDRSALMIADIVGRVSIFHDIEVPVLQSKEGRYELALPRQEAMWLCRKLSKYSFPQIARVFGGRHHTTIIDGVRVMEKYIRQGDIGAKDLIVMLREFPNVQHLGAMH